MRGIAVQRLGTPRSTSLNRQRVSRAGSGAPRSSERLRIALLAPVWFAVPPTGYGGTELVVDLLGRALMDAGHDVTIFASGDSTTRVPLSWVSRHALSDRLGEPLPELRHVLACYERAAEFDVINDHTGPLAATAAGLVTTPILHTVHLPVGGELGDVYERLARLSSDLALVSLSLSQRRLRPSLPWVANCPNAIDPARFAWSRRRGDYLAFVGRMGPEKGCRWAIAAARECGLPLKIAAKCRDRAEHACFAEYVEPFLGAGIEYLGEVGHAAKVELLRGARATLFPIDWEEPFGLVMLESLACGTPVVATRRGAVPEVIEDGHTGILVDRHDELADAIVAVDQLDRAACRLSVERRFSPKQLERSYLAAYRKVLERHGVAGKRSYTRP